ncbi:hypothetical protein E0494_10850 [Marinilabiliaceae bacterium JC040]|nr:hypothetical protein [Marinilabiliaceae bacterium JC040]
MRLIILSLLFSIQLNCNAQNNKKFNELLRKFKLVEWPYDFSYLDGNNGKEISKEEYNIFLNLDHKKWKYGGDYAYRAESRINFNDFIGLIFKFDYDPDNYGEVQGERKLYIYDKNGNIKSSLLIHGVFIKEDREINFKFKSNLKIEIITDNYIDGKEKPIVHSNFYKINPDTGEIVEISK